MRNDGGSTNRDVRIWGTVPRILAFFALLAVASSCIPEPNITGVGTNLDADSTTDQGPRSDAADSGVQTDLNDQRPDSALTCEECPVGEVCLVEELRCVQCAGNDDCGVGVCEPGSHTCVDCLESANCVSPELARCTDEFSCVQCESDDDCARFGATPTCFEGACVECSADNDEACAGRACNPRSSTCTDNAFKSLTTCQPCETDNECETGSLCVAMEFDGAARGDGESGYCLPINTGDPCELTNRVNTLSSGLPSLDDPTVRSFCAPNQQVTTCEAVLQYGASCVVDDDCGAEAGDALCLVVGGVAGTRCTFECTDGQDCPELVACGDVEKICGRP